MAGKAIDKSHVPSSLFYFHYYGIPVEEYVYGIRLPKTKNYNVRLLCTKSSVIHGSSYTKMASQKGMVMKLVCEMFGTKDRPVTGRIDAELDSLDEVLLAIFNFLAIGGQHP